MGDYVQVNPFKAGKSILQLNGVLYFHSETKRHIIIMVDKYFWNKLLTPVNEVCEGYNFRFVCDSFHGWGRAGVCLSACWDTPPINRHPSVADTPIPDTPWVSDTLMGCKDPP